MAILKEIYLCIYWLAMSNSMYNPMIYCYMNQRLFKLFMITWWCGAFEPNVKIYVWNGSDDSTNYDDADYDNDDYGDCKDDNDKYYLQV